jgi:hypothetical protein
MSSRGRELPMKIIAVVLLALYSWGVVHSLGQPAGVGRVFLTVMAMVPGILAIFVATGMHKVLRPDAIESILGYFRKLGLPGVLLVIAFFVVNLWLVSFLDTTSATQLWAKILLGILAWIPGLGFCGLLFLSAGSKGSSPDLEERRST